MDDREKEQKQYTGTKGLSWAIVVGVAIGTVIGKLTDNMNTGLMIGLAIGVAGWVLLFNRRPQTQSADEDNTQEQSTAESDEK